MLNVDCVYGHDEPVGRLTRTFGPGKLYGIAGPNGAGKSTLLATIAGELDPVEGSVSVDGADPAALAGAGVVTRIAEPEFYPDLTVGEHLRLLGRVSGVSYDATIEVWRLNDLLAAPPGWLSSGQRQRVFLAAQLTAAAGVIVIDEPERHLDSDWVEFLCGELRELARDGALILVASHSPVVLAVCDDVVELG